MTLPAGSRVLFVRLSAPGDVALELPALATLRAARPDLHLAWVTEDRCADLLQGLPDLDEVIVMPRRQWRELRRESGRTAAFRAMRGFGRELAAGDWDAALDFQGNLKSGLVTRASRARRRIGFARGQTREPNWVFTRERVSLPDPRLHRRERDAALLRTLLPGTELDLDLSPDFGLRPEEIAFATDCLAAPGPSSGPRLVIHGGTSDFFIQKRWAPERYAAVIDALHASHGVQSILSYGPGERPQAEAIAAKANVAVTIPDRVPSWRELAALFRRADLALGSDTGPLHLASVLGTPTVILFGPYDPGPLHPWRHPERARYAAIPCSPCRYRDCPRALCMEELAEAGISATLRAILDGTTPPVGPTVPHRTITV